MKKDIEDRADIDRLMRVFYSKAMADDTIGYIFTDVAKLDLDHHLPIIGDFWETLLFQTGNYARHGRNPLEVHGRLNQKTPLTSVTFADGFNYGMNRWMSSFREIGVSF
jgi:hemoglobin